MGPLRDLIRATFELLKQTNKTNYKAFIKTRRIPEEFCDLDFGEDCDAMEVLTGSFGEFCPPVGDLVEVESESQREELLEEWGEHEEEASDAEDEANEVLEQAEEAVGNLQGELLLTREELDATPSVEAGLEGKLEKTRLIFAVARAEAEQARLACVSAKKLFNDWGDVINDLRSADWTPNEIYITKLRRYYEDDINLEAAKRCGLAVVRRDSDDSTWLGLTGCGMDLSAKFMAYQALEYNAIDEQYVRMFGESRYWESVISTELAREVEKTLGIEHCMEQADQDAKARMAAFEASLKGLAQQRRDGTDELLIQAQALAALLKAAP